jgi:hypothetical protein
MDLDCFEGGIPLFTCVRRVGRLSYLRVENLDKAKF